jgi:hypothetical protein
MTKITVEELKAAIVSNQNLAAWYAEDARYFADLGLAKEACHYQNDAAYSSAFARNLLLALLDGEGV